MGSVDQMAADSETAAAGTGAAAGSGCLQKFRLYETRSVSWVLSYKVGSFIVICFASWVSSIFFPTACCLSLLISSLSYQILDSMIKSVWFGGNIF